MLALLILFRAPPKSSYDALPVDAILRMRPTEASSSNVRFSRMARKNCFGNKTKAASGYHRFPDGSKCLGSCTVWKETTLDEQGRLMNNAYLTGSHPEHIPIVLGASLFIAWTKVKTFRNNRAGIYKRTQRFSRYTYRSLVHATRHKSSQHNCSLQLSPIER